MTKGMWCLGVAGIFALVGCSSDGESGTTTKPNPIEPAKEVQAEAPRDHGAPSTTYPAFTPNMAMLRNKGGRILEAPIFVTVVWDDNPNAPTYEALADSIGASAYWKEIVGEYGVGVATSGAANHVREKTPITLSSDPNADPVDAIITYMKERLAAPTSGWPAPTDQTLYTLFIGGEAAKTLCADGAGGLHDSFALNGKEIPFALVLECEGAPNMTALDDATISASHELAEAAVDPFPETSPAWQGLEDAYGAWELMQLGQDENGDMCEFYKDAYGKVAPELPFTLQRQWSNASARAGHSPCVPQGASPYFNVTPLEPADPITLTPPVELGLPFSPNTTGVKLAVGESRTIPLGIYSDAATDAISVRAFESDPMDEYAEPMSESRHKLVEIFIDKAAGTNGEKTYLTLKMLSKPSLGAALILVETTIGSTKHMLPILVGPGADAGSSKAATGAAKRILPSSRSRRVTLRR